MTNIKSFLPILIIFILIAGCSTTAVKNSWKNPAFNQKNFQKVLVIGVHKEVGVRTEYESKLTNKLKSVGINAISASSIKGLYGERTKEQVIDIVKRDGYDSVLVTKYQALKQEEIYKPGYTEYQVIGYRGLFDPFYYNSLIEVHHPGYTVDRETLFLEVSLFETGEGQIVWRGQTASINPSRNNVVDDVITAVTDKIKSAAIFN